jgi:hypothetical protein
VYGESDITDRESEARPEAEIRLLGLGSFSSDSEYVTDALSFCWYAKAGFGVVNEGAGST